MDNHSGKITDTNPALTNKVKLVVWDLDDTLWEGTLSEEEITIPSDNINLIKQLTDIGIVNSICSKNDYEPVKDKLTEAGIWDYFVFASINWASKGERIKQLISDMQLRPANVLFIDDNMHNLEEARFCCPEIMTAAASEIPSLYKEAFNCEKKDPTHKRLKQYRILEEKVKTKTSYSTNEEFLFSSNIQVNFGYDCKDKLERIHDLVMRSNQLNFTKIRSTRQELEDIIKDSQAECGYITVQDNFGDYGLVGFYAVKEGKLIHFCFSCRILGMGVEQFVYNSLNRPNLVINGNVVASLEDESIPKWINQNKSIEQADKLTFDAKIGNSVLIKGPCDLSQLFPFINNSELIDTEFTFVNDKGITVEATGHTTAIVESLRLSDKQKQRVCDEVRFIDKMIYNDAIWNNDYKVVIISILSDANLGVYKRKDTGERFPFNPGVYPLTDKNNWENLINGKYFTSQAVFTREELEEFSDKYEFEGINTPEKIVENIKYIRKNLPKSCALAVMLGGELKYDKADKEFADRHIVHKKINDAIREIAEDYNIHLIDVNKYLVDQSSFYRHFNHYVKPVYYQLACDIVSLINNELNVEMKKPSKAKLTLLTLKQKLGNLYYRLKKQ